MRLEIVFKNYEVMCFIGIHDFEIDRPQRVSVNIRAKLNVSLAIVDDMSAVVDYDYIKNGIDSLVCGGVFKTQEYLIARILSVVFQNNSIDSVVLETSKCDVYPMCDGVGLRIEIDRGEWLSSFGGLS